ncbi:type 1 fimbrial protein [Cronobacter dublinensis]|nr:type 1 fimbrial protein [Cronobacter dublinensis]
MKKALLFIFLLASATQTIAGAYNIDFSGTLVAEPCTLPDADKDVWLDFSTIETKYLYQYQRTKSQPFFIHLQECDPAILNTVSITFQGTADTELTDLMAVDASSTAKGIAIGIEREDGTLLPINKASPEMPLITGETTLNFKAFVQIQPTVLANKSLNEGTFNAISTFILGYQ